MNPKAVGERAEAMILAAVVARGYSASIPFGNNQRYDLIIDDGRDLFRVQCKSGWLYRGSVHFTTASHNGFTGERRQYDGQVEFFLVYEPVSGKIYKVPAAGAPRSQMSLRLAKQKPRGRRSARWAKDFEF